MTEAGCIKMTYVGLAVALQPIEDKHLSSTVEELYKRGERLHTQLSTQLEEGKGSSQTLTDVSEVAHSLLVACPNIHGYNGDRERIGRLSTELGTLAYIARQCHQIGLVYFG